MVEEDDEECSICLEILELGDIAILSCNDKHKFHFSSL